MSKPATKKRRPKRRKLTPEELNQRRFVRRIKTMFANMGFSAVPTEGKEAQFGNKTGEIDGVFVYQNIIIAAEYTSGKQPFDHAKNKKLLADEILSNKDLFLRWLIDNFPDQSDLFTEYSFSRYTIFFIYISEVDMSLEKKDIALLRPMTVMTPQALAYFDRLAKTIRKSARTDFWRFLNLNSSDIGRINASTQARTIEATIISPEDSTRFGNGIRLVSFMISADVLLRNSYVLRKDNWGYSSDLYQRLIDSNRIGKIREYVAKDGSAFLNNIILGLPPTVSFQTQEGAAIELSDAQSYTSFRMTIPDEFNSLCIIDGQHRIFAHYEGTDALEPKVAAIRNKIHLLATGLIFPPDMGDLEVTRVQSEIFLAINDNTKPVPPDVLLAIKTLQNPYEDIAIARRVLEALNKKTAFKGMFQLSQMDPAPIKIASIVKYALRYLVDVEKDSGLFSEWTKEYPLGKELKESQNVELLEKYTDYCASNLNMYFSALKNAFSSSWQDSNSKIKSTTVINAMIIALRRSLPALGLLTFDEYSRLMKSWEIDFSKGIFPYSSSQYNLFSREILSDMFGLIEHEEEWILPTIAD